MKFKIKGGQLAMLLVPALAFAAPAFAQVFNAPLSSGPQRDSLQDADTFVSFIDSALPRSQGRIYFDDITRMRRPTRANAFSANSRMVWLSPVASM